MSQSAAVSARILDLVSRAPGCQLDELVLVCSDLTWNQVFLEIDRLSRVGHVRLRSAGRGVYTVWLPEKPTTISHSSRSAIMKIMSAVIRQGAPCTESPMVGRREAAKQVA